MLSASLTIEHPTRRVGSGKRFGINGTYRAMDPNNPRNVIQLPRPGLLERALARIATELHYTRPPGRLWPDILLLPLAIVFCVGYALSIYPAVLRSSGHNPASETPFAGIITLIVGLVFFLSLGVFGVIQGVGLKRPSSIVLGTLMLSIVASVSVLILFFVR
jgi:hypothetical protein